jgi:ABC-type lipoprotein release transport system permease subunit
LLPTIVTKVHWKELDEDVFLIGTRGEVPILERAVKKPLQDQVPQGTIVLGYHLHKHHKLKVDDKVTFLGQELTVTSCYAERGSKDDVTVWMNLKQVQEILGMQNQINAIMALECNCATADRVAEIRAEIEKILPSTQVIEMGGKALARAEARNEAKKSADAALLQAQEHHRQRARFSVVSVTVVVIGAGAWICFLTLGNVRQRRSEIGILRALGVRSKQILMIFMGKAVIVGLIGGVTGYLGGYVVGLLAVNKFGIGNGDELGAMALSLETATNIFQLELLVAAVLMAPLLAGLASWVPAVMAARQDPAVILVEE